MKKNIHLSLNVFVWLFVSGALADVMPIAFDEAPPSTEVPEIADFFTLETVDFNRDRRQGSPDKRKAYSAISLSPKGLDRFANRKKSLLAQEHADRAEEFIRQNNLEEAVREVDKALLRDPENMLMLGRAGLIYAAARHYEEASAMLRIYLQNLPDQVNHLAAWGGVLLRLDDQELAEAMLSRSLVLDPVNLMAHYQMDVLLLVQGRPLPDTTFWPLLDAVHFRMALGFLLSDRDELESMLGAARFELLCDRIIGPGTALRLDVIRDTLDQYADNERSPTRNMSVTVDLCEKLIHTGMHNQSIFMALAQAYYEMGRMDDAWTIIRAVQSNYPDYQSAWFNGGLIALQLKNYGLA
ncbi:MAG: tetratricopeptide repeat protein, partial [Kiritimatiellae bacterium]|nr:tetratricopeptide repeat protein [Kiritimatiellia bacterium]